jgi:hypothetical protein
LTAATFSPPRPARLHDRLQQRQHRRQPAELLLVQQDVGLLHLADHLLRIGDEVGREVAAVELHALDHLELGGQRLGLLNGDRALLADLLHGVGDHLADRLLAIGRDGADLGDLGAPGDLPRAPIDVVDRGFDRHVDAAFEVHGVHAGGDRLDALAQDRLGQHRGCGGAVARQLAGLDRDLAQHPGAHVLQVVGELDGLGHGDAVLADARTAIGLADQHVAAFGAERRLDRLGHDVDAAEQARARVLAESHLGRYHGDGASFGFSFRVAAGRWRNPNPLGAKTH